jgi:hypothetical protein
MRLALAGFVATAALCGGSMGMVRSQGASAQDELATDGGSWVDPTLDGAWTDPTFVGDGSESEITVDVDLAIADVWSAEEGAATVDTAPVAADPTYDANGNLIDPYTGAPLAIGADGAPIDVVRGLYYDDYGNLIDPATGLAVTIDGSEQAAPTGAETGEFVDGGAVAAAPEEFVPELVTTPWLAPPPSGPPPGYANWNPPRTVFIPVTGHAIDGVFLDAWRAWGGATSWGLPLTAEFQENGRTVQYYDFGRFEYHPEDPDGTVVQFGDLGRQLQPFMLRRASGSGSQAANEVALAVRAWLPGGDSVRPDSAEWRFVPETGHGVGGAFKNFWEATGEASYLGNPLSEPYKLAGVTFQVFQKGALAQRPGESPALVPVGKLMVERLGLDTTPMTQGELPIYDESLFVPPPMSTVSGAPVDPFAEKWVQISISLQYLWAYQGDQVLWQGYISTGTAKFQTPTGSFYVLSKLPSQTMEGVLGGEYYNVPDVPDVMYFTDRGHAIHGTYWHSNFGTPMSHGCVNLAMDVADWMYQWAPIGMRVEIVP